jgi:hypothetical protein
MAVDIHQAPGDQYMEVELSGKVAKEDYAHFVPAIESAIAQHGKLRLLILMRNFHGWSIGALWEDIKFDWQHFRDFERIAMVGEKRWEAGMATFCKPFTTAKIKYFDVAETDEARRWITADLSVAVTL